MYGFAYHPDREYIHRLKKDNEVNPGLALHYEFAENERSITFAEVGLYDDSGRNWAKFAALGYQLKFGERWKIGGAVALISSHSYNRGVAVIGMFPLITYDMGRVKLNAVYFPKFGQYSKVDAYGVYISIPFGQWAGQSGRKP